MILEIAAGRLLAPYVGVTIETYTATIDAAAHCIWHYNQTPLAADSSCLDNSHYPSLPSEPALWPAGSAWPDYFMFGDPHNNFYEGEVYYDDIRMDVNLGQMFYFGTNPAVQRVRTRPAQKRVIARYSRQTVVAVQPLDPVAIGVPGQRVRGEPQGRDTQGPAGAVRLTIRG